MPNRNAFIAAARSLINTPFIHQGRLPKTKTCKGGLDCAGLGIVAAKKIGVIVPDIIGYDRTPDGESLLAHLNKVLIPIHVNDVVPGDILIMYFVASPQHIAVLSELNGNTTIIHASLTDKRVTEHIISTEWKQRVIRAYKIPGIE